MTRTPRRPGTLARDREAISRGRAGRAAVLAAIVVAAALAAAATLVRDARGRGADVAIGERTLRSRALGMTLRFAVSLPPGYDDGGRYPVIYFLHGLPASASAFRDIGFVRRALEQVGGRAVVVAPQAARDGDSDPEYIDWGEGRNWETAIARELPAYVDRHFRTIPNRRGRALVGISAGGYGAMLIGLHHLDTFSVIESWSGYHRPTDPDGTSVLDLGSPAANARASAHALIGTLRRSAARRPLLLGFYVGRRDSRFRRDNVLLDAELRAARVPHLFRLYGGGHDQALWSAHAGEWLGRALAALAPAVDGAAATTPASPPPDLSRPALLPGRP